MCDDDILIHLREYWDDQGIAANIKYFTCKYQQPSIVGAPSHKSCNLNKGVFLTPKETFIGTEYEKHTLPRILFISLDPADDSPGPQPYQRDWHYVRLAEEQWDHAQLNEKPHWRETHEMAYNLLKGTAQRLGIKLPGPKGLICKYFANTNSAKCKNMGLGSDQAQPHVFKNCSEYIPGEVLRLRPDMIITQGADAAKSIRGQFNIKNKSGNTASTRIDILDMGGHDVLKFESWHPTRRDSTFGEEKRDFFPTLYEYVNNVFFKNWQPPQC
jgi:hypothetical protein